MAKYSYWGVIYYLFPMSVNSKWVLGAWLIFKVHVIKKTETKTKTKKPQKHIMTSSHCKRHGEDRTEGIANGPVLPNLCSWI